MRFNYQPGKSQLVSLTGIIGSGGSGITTEIGQLDDNNGLFFRVDDGIFSVVKRSYVTGSAVDTVVTQDNFNVDKLDGTGSSGISIDLDKTQIFFFDYEWLGVGRVRMGIFNNGVPVYCHEFNHNNDLDVVYMSNPNLPLRYSIENDGTGVAASLDHICSSVISEGGRQNLGVLRNISTEGTHVDADAADTLYAIISVSLQSGKESCSVDIEKISMLAETNDAFEWQPVWNASIAGSPSYSNIANSCLRYFTGTTANTVTGGVVFDGGFATSNASISENVPNAIRLGASYSGTLDTITLCARPLSINLDIQGSITCRELS